MNDYIKKQIADIDLKIAEAQKLLEDPSVAQLAQAEIEELTKQKVQKEKVERQRPTSLKEMLDLAKKQASS